MEPRLPVDMATSPMVRASETTAREIAARLTSGGVIIVPTETVYGLAISPGSRQTAQRVFRLKGRPRDLNLPVIIGHIDQLDLLGVELNASAQSLTAAFWPGPLTLVMGFRDDRERAPWLA